MAENEIPTIEDAVDRIFDFGTDGFMHPAQVDKRNRHRKSLQFNYQQVAAATAGAWLREAEVLFPSLPGFLLPVARVTNTDRKA